MIPQEGTTKPSREPVTISQEEPTTRSLAFLQIRRRSETHDLFTHESKGRGECLDGGYFLRCEAAGLLWIVGGGVTLIPGCPADGAGLCETTISNILT